MQVGVDRVPAAGDGAVEDKDGQQRAAHHDAGLDEVRPDDGLDAAQRGVDGSEHDHADAGEKVDQEEAVGVGGNGGVQDTAAGEFVDEDQRDSGDVDARAGGENPRDEEHGAGGVLGTRAEALREVLVDAVDVEAVVRRQENKGDDDPREDGAEGELDEQIVALVVALAGRAEEGARAGFRRDERGEHGPPGDLASAEGEVAQGVLASAHAQADGEDQREIPEDHRPVDQPRELHGGIRDRQRAAGKEKCGFSMRPMTLPASSRTAARRIPSPTS